MSLVFKIILKLVKKEIKTKKKNFQCCQKQLHNAENGVMAVICT